MNTEELENLLKADAFGRLDPSEQAHIQARPFEARLQLRRMIADISEQLDKLGGDREWRGRATRLRSRLMVRLEEYEERCAGLDSRYRAAIERHRTEVTAANEAGDRIDEELWAVLEQ